MSRKLYVESLQSRLCLTVGFVTHEILEGGNVDVDGTRSIDAADFNGDGNLDLLATTVSGGAEGKIIWYPNIGGGAFDRLRMIDPEPSIEAKAVDIDSDGDLDVVAAKLEGVVWYENVDGSGNFGEAQLMHDILQFMLRPADIDGDGDTDIVTATQNSMTWIENLGDNNFQSHPISTDSGPTELQVIDMTADGKPDIVVMHEDRVEMLRNVDAVFATPKELLSSTVELTAMAVGRFDADNDVDVYVAAGQTLTLYSNGANGFNAVSPSLIAHRRDTVETMQAVDLNVDGELDLLVSHIEGSSNIGRSIVEAYMNTGTGLMVVVETLGTPTVAPAVFAKLALSGDFDNDGRPEVVAAGHPPLIGDPANVDHISLHRVSLVGEVLHPVPIARQGSGATSLAAGDIDADGDTDLVAASFYDGRIMWFENTNGLGRFGEQELIDVQERVRSIGVINDGNDRTVHLVVAADNGLWLYTNNMGNFVSHQLSEGPASSVDVGDFDDDGDEDVLAVVRTSRTGGDYNTLLFEQTATGQFGSTIHVATSQRPVAAVFMDLTGNGGLDVVQSDTQDLVSFDRGTNFEQTTIHGRGLVNASQGQQPVVEDWDNDGDEDLLGIGRFDPYVENLGAGQGLALRRFTSTVGVSFSYGTRTPFDIDEDGILDVLASGTRSDERHAELAWQRHDGAFGLEPPRFLTDVSETGWRDSDAMLVCDFDRDGDDDVVSSHHSTGTFITGAPASDGGIRWYENRLLGDANDDSSVDVRDFLALSRNFGASEATVTWEQGDFNHDGTVDVNDFLILSREFGKTRS